MRIFQYQQLFRPVPKPGGEAETIYDGAWHRPTEQPQRNYAVRKIQSAALAAAVPFLFFQPIPVITDRLVLTDAVSQPLDRVPSRVHTYPSLFYQHFLFTGQPAVDTNQANPRSLDRRHVHQAFFFQENTTAAFTFPVPTDLSQPQRQVVRIAPRVPSLFFQHFLWTDQPAVDTSQANPRGQSRLHTYPSLFFQENPTAAFTFPIPVDVAQPQRRVVRAAPYSPAFFFHEFPIVFTGQPAIDQFQPQPRITRWAPYAPSFFFDPFPRPATFSDQIPLDLSQPLARVLRLAPYGQTIFFADTPVAFSGRVEDAISQPTIARPRFQHEAYFAPVSTAGETIYLPGWFQPTAEPWRNLAERKAQRTWLAAAAPTFNFLPDLAAMAFTQFGLIRLIASPGMSIYFEVHMKTSNATYPAEARLYNITDVGVVPLSHITTPALSMTRVRSAALTLPVAAKEYRVEFGGQASVGATYTIYAADLIFGG